MKSITLADGTALVAGGAVVEGAPSITLVTLNFLAGGGDQYLFGVTSRGLPISRALHPGELPI